MAADDQAEVFVNGMSVGTIGSVTNVSLAFAAQSSLTSFDITSFLVTGINVITVRGTNGPFGCGAGPYSCNNAGVVFGGSLLVGPPGQVVERISLVSNPTWPVLNTTGTFIGFAQNICQTLSPPQDCMWGVGAANLSSIPGASWIWAPGIAAATSPAFPAQFSFSKTFLLSGTPIAGTISVAADDQAEVFVNGMSVGTIGSVTNVSLAFAAQSSLTSFDITSFLVTGINVITVRGTNGPFGCGAGPYSCNNAGVVFGGSLLVAPPPGGELLSLSPAKLFIGLKNSDDVGTRFDLRVEVHVNGSAVASGMTRCVNDVTRDPYKAREVTIAFDPFTPVSVSSVDVLALRVLTRIGTNLDDTKCPGHNSAVGLRLYYDAVSRPSRFDVEIGPSPSEDLFLRSDGGACKDVPSAGVTALFLDNDPPLATGVKCRDSTGINFSNGNPWREIGSWTIVQ